MVAIPPGRFTMGSPGDEVKHSVITGAETPQHEVKIDHVFALSREPISVAAFSAFVDDTHYEAGDIAIVVRDGRYVNEQGRSWRDPGFAQARDHPATCINWHDAQAFIGWLNSRLELTGRPDAYRLPSEAEWEYACLRGDADAIRASVRRSPPIRRISTDGEVTNSAPPSLMWRRTTTSGPFSENGFGLFDMHGNVWEWCEDRWHLNYNGAPSDGSAWDRRRTVDPHEPSFPARGSPSQRRSWGWLGHSSAAPAIRDPYGHQLLDAARRRRLSDRQDHFTDDQVMDRVHADSWACSTARGKTALVDAAPNCGHFAWGHEAEVADSRVGSRPADSVMP